MKKKNNFDGHRGGDWEADLSTLLDLALAITQCEELQDGPRTTLSVMDELFDRYRDAHNKRLNTLEKFIQALEIAKTRREDARRRNAVRTAFDEIVSVAFKDAPVEKLDWPKDPEKEDS